MASKRKAALTADGAAKALMTSRTSTPGPATQRGGGDDTDHDLDRDHNDDDGSGAATPELAEPSSEFSRAVDRNVQKFDIRAFPYRLSPGLVDSASALFRPEQERDFTALALKPDHENRPLWIDGWGGLILESFHPLAPRVQDFLITIAEPVSRPSFLHEYKLTTHSLYAAVSVGLTPEDIVNTLNRFLKNQMPPNMVLRDNKYYVETTDLDILQMLLRDPEIGPCRVQDAQEIITTSAPRMAGLAVAGSKEAAGIREAEGLDKVGGARRNPTGQEAVAGGGGGGGAPGSAAGGGGGAAENVYAVLEDDGGDDDRDVIHAFQIRDDKVGTVAQRCLDLHYPALEEYDFRNDHANANLEIDLRPGTQIRPYQEKSLSKMFGNGRVKSGIIGVVVLATSNMSVVQWRNEFLKWSNVDPDSIAIFSSDRKSTFSGNTGIIITTYSMVTNTRERAYESAKMMKFLQGREWGLMLLDEVHVVPAQMFRRVIGSIKAHSKLGLTATLLREDDKIEDLNFLIGPKLYEANWMELSQQGHIAKVQCAEVWCPMPTEFYEEYLKASPRNRSLFCVMNPRKFQACQ
ncbi:hypothetical protein VTK73DRAFT_1735 [Phialemonium thermophilum]|uniref:DNA 3'-5' helicase n=1 Tax=Phialemonium thermophilum TaxID=223376 RepID=A0ABR3VT17_9PEZI